MSQPARAAREQSDQTAGSYRLLLDIELNGQHLNILGDFRFDRNGNLWVTPQELGTLGIDVTRLPSTDQFLQLGAIPGLTYRYDAPNQKLELTCAPILLRETRINAYVDHGPQELSPTATGAVLNYTILGTTRPGPRIGIDLGGQIDGRIFGPFGLIRGSSFVNAPAGHRSEIVRLDTSWTLENPRQMTVLRAGDAISSGLSSTRPIRFGGIQFGRNFGLRPDLITLPLPIIRGSAQTPSSLDLYVDGAHKLTSQIPAGPFALQYAPNTIGAGASRVVVTDVLGRQALYDLPFYATDALLAPKLLDFSVEAGFARRDFGISSGDYAGNLGGSATIRYGATQNLTVQAHTEAGSGLFNIGVGSVFTLGRSAVASASVAVSRQGRSSGSFFDLAVEARRGRFAFSVRATRSNGSYRDLAAVTARGIGFASQSAFLPPRATEQAQLSTRLWSNATTASLSYARIEREDSRMRVASVSLNQRFRLATFYMRGTKDLGQSRSTSFSLGLSLPLGHRSFASAEATSNDGRYSMTAQASGRPVTSPGDIGWRVSVAQGAVNERLVAASYLSPAGRIEAGVSQGNGGATGFFQAEGGVAFVDGSLFASRRLDNPFAVVSIGSKNTDIYSENRLSAKTNAHGRALIPNLVAYQPNNISIDTTQMPLNAEIPVDHFIITPRSGSAAVLRLKPNNLENGAIVSFVDTNGLPIPAGALGTLGRNQKSFVVGYDGQSYVKELEKNNRVAIEDASGRTCTANFSFKPDQNRQIKIGPVPCLPIVIASR